MARERAGFAKGFLSDGRDATVIRLSLASPEVIHSWSRGEVKKPETINYRTFKPERDGLFCERIFGPVKSWECSCGKYKKLRHKDIICDRCGVEVVDSKVRRDRMGHIELAAPVAHVWFVRSVPSRMAVMLGISGRELEKVIYYEQFIVLDPGKTGLKRRALLNEGEFRKIQQEIHGRTLKAKIGAEAIRDLLREVDLNTLSKLLQIAMVLPISMDDLELRVAFEEAYVVMDPGKSGMKKYEVISEKEFRGAQGKAGLKAKTGAEAIRDLSKEAEVLQKSKDKKDISTQKMKELLRRLKVVEAFRRSTNRPEWMVLDVLPVQPPDLRPLVPLDGGRFATSDLNDLYRRVINRNNRLKRLIEIKAPEIIIQNEKRMLQESVDALFDNGRGGHVVKGTGNRPLKSLSDMLKGKPGRFRQNLLGKRVDYSGRSVIVVGPDLKLHECGLPKEMALELFKPFIIRKLEERDYVTTIKSAKKLVERSSPEVWDVLEEVIEEHPVMLNRAPTLHRLSVQAFQPILVEGKAIQIHPLVCAAFNADFDGDQMAVHVPLSVEAQLEARLLMMATNNILSPANGAPIVGPTQDMVMGIYYLTAMPKIETPRVGRIAGSKGNGDNAFAVYTPAEVEQLYDHRRVGLHDRVRVRYGGWATVWSTVGRVLFTTILPDRIKFPIPVGVRIDNLGGIIDIKEEFVGLGKGILTKLIEYCYHNLGKTETIKFLNGLKKIGFEFATRCGVTVGLEDMPDIDAKHIGDIPDIKTKEDIVKAARQKVDDVYLKYQKNAITERERYKNVIDIWTQATNDVTTAMRKIMEKSMGGLNPIHMMAHSGARGREDQVRQLAGMRGLMARPQQRITGDVGEIIEFPIVSNFKEGLSVFEYFTSTHGARKGLADTALKTADAGYLTRRLVDVAQDVKIVEEDCGTINGIVAKAIGRPGYKDKKDELRERIEGRTVVDNIVCLITDGEEVREEVLIQAGKMISRETANLIAENIDSVVIRSVLTCESKHGLCAKCYGKDLATGREYVGDDIRRRLGELYRREIDREHRDVFTPEAEERLYNVLARRLLGKPGLLFTREAFAGVHALFKEKYQESAGKLSVGDILSKFQKDVDALLGIDADLVSLGEAVGVIAGQSIGEPGTQLTLRTFHVGGTASRVISEPRLMANLVRDGGSGRGDEHKAMSGVVKYDDKLVTVNPGGKQTRISNRGNVRIIDAETADKPEKDWRILQDISIPENIPLGAVLLKKNGDHVKHKEIVASWNPYTVSIFAQADGIVRWKDILEGKTMQVEEVTEFDVKTRSNQTRTYRRIIEPKDPGDRVLHPQIQLETPDGTVHSYSVPVGANLVATDGSKVEACDDLAQIPREEHRTGDITGGLPRVAELFDARRPKNCAVISEIEGAIRIYRVKLRVTGAKGEMREYLVPEGYRLEIRSGDKASSGQQIAVGQGEPVVSEIDGTVSVLDQGARKVQVVPPKGTAREYLIPPGRHLEVRNGDKVRAGDPLTDGSIDPHDVLEAGGREQVQDFLVNKIQEVYRLQGVTINDKHIEVIIRQMLRKVTISDPGDTTFLVGQPVDKARFMEENARVHEKGGRPAKGKDILLGITRSALSTESWVSAASFQETTRVLAEAAVQGLEDKLAGLKENVIMGHLISAGTGFFDEEEVGLDMPKELETPPTAATISARMDKALEEAVAEKAPEAAPEKEPE